MMLLLVLRAFIATLVLSIAFPKVISFRSVFGPRLRHSFFFGTQRFTFWRWDSSILNDPRKCENSTSIQSRITGGDVADRNMFPYQVGLLLLQTPSVIQCGGALVTQNYVLTAAHCLYQSTLGKVFLGTNIFADTDSASMVYNVTRKDFRIHEGFFPFGPVLDDIALIHLSKPAVLSSAVQTIPLARAYMTQDFLEGEITTASGWGRTSDADIRSARNDSEYLLYYIDTRVLNQKKCACFYVPGLVRSRNHLCTDGMDGVGTCDGDSGGPLTYYHRGFNYLVGLTAFGSAGGCEIGFPSVYTRVTTYLDWIEKNSDVKITQTSIP